MIEMQARHLSTPVLMFKITLAFSSSSSSSIIFLVLVDTWEYGGYGRTHVANASHPLSSTDRRVIHLVEERPSRIPFRIDGTTPLFFTHPSMRQLIPRSLIPFLPSFLPACHIPPPFHQPHHCHERRSKAFAGISRSGHRGICQPVFLSLAPRTCLDDKCHAAKYRCCFFFSGRVNPHGSIPPLSLLSPPPFR